jgi:hypothetical protein
MLNSILFFRGKKARLQEFPVEAGNVGDGDIFWAHRFTLGFVATVPEAQSIHFL